MTEYNELVKCRECKFWSETEKWFGICLKSGFKTPKDFLGEDGERKDKGMTDYTKLIEALRICANTAFCNECPLDDTCYNANKLQLDAADAIEALQKTLKAEQEDA